jgi:hypothetical protein
LLTELDLSNNNFGGMYSLALIDRVYIWKILVIEFICFFIASDGYISIEVQNNLSKTCLHQIPPDPTVETALEK